MTDQIFTVEEACGWDVNNLPTHSGLLHRGRQAFAKGLSVDFDRVFIGAVLVGQEWYVFLNGVVDRMNNEVAARWLRSRNRARIQVCNAQDLLVPVLRADIERRLVSLSYGLQSNEEILSNIERIAQRMAVHRAPEICDAPA